MKEAGPSVLEPFAGASRYRNHGHRVVAGQRLTQAASDILLGWVKVEGIDGKQRDFYIRQLWDGKGSAEIESMSATTMAGYSGLCGWTLARAHARTGDRQAIAAYLGKGDKFDRAIAEFSDAYADQNEADYRVVAAARDAGELSVESGISAAFADRPATVLSLEAGTDPAIEVLAPVVVCLAASLHVRGT